MKKDAKYHIGILATHPVQYYVPWYRALAKKSNVDLEVFYCHRQTPEDQAKAGFGVPFDWDVPLLEGYNYLFINNIAPHPSVYTFLGCDTPEIYQIISKTSFDAFIVHGWHIKSFWQAMRACWKTHTPVLVRGDSYLPSDYLFFKRWAKYPFYRWFIAKFDAYLAVGEHAKAYYIHYGADERKIFLVPHVVDNDFFSQQSDALRPERDMLRKNWGIPEQVIVFLFVGRLIQKKRPHDFLKALKMAHAASQGIFGLIIGDGPLRHSLEREAKKSDMPVVFGGFLNQKEITKAYVASDVLVLPSDVGETWGLVVNEAMACGLPAVVSDKVGCAPDLVHPGETGEVFRCGDVKKLSEIFVDFSLNQGEAKHKGESAKNLVSRYSTETSVNETLRAARFSVNNINPKGNKR